MSAGLLTVLTLIPLLEIYAFYKQGEAVEALTEGTINRWILFLLWFVFSPAVWFITQSELNKRAPGSSQPGPEPAAPR